MYGVMTFDSRFTHEHASDTGAVSNASAVTAASRASLNTKLASYNA